MSSVEWSSHFTVLIFSFIRSMCTAITTLPSTWKGQNWEHSKPPDFNLNAVINVALNFYALYIKIILPVWKSVKCYTAIYHVLVHHYITSIFDTASLNNKWINICLLLLPNIAHCWMAAKIYVKLYWKYYNTVTYTLLGFGVWGSSRHQAHVSQAACRTNRNQKLIKNILTTNTHFHGIQLNFTLFKYHLYVINERFYDWETHIYKTARGISSEISFLPQGFHNACGFMKMTW